MHVASTTIFEGPAPAHEEFRDHIARRLHLVPRFRQKLRFVPFGQGRPVWVDDPHLNLDYHVRQTALPPPGSEEQLRNLAARVFSQQLDRSKPLWELWLVEGLEDGRFAIIGKSHHALVDGVSGVDITTVLFDTAREPETPPERRPGVAAEARAERRQAARRRPARAGHEPGRDRPRGARGAARAAPGRLPGCAAASAPPARCSAPDSRRRPRRSTSRSARTGGSPASAATSTSSSGSRTSTAARVNDVVLSVVAGALGNYLRARGHDTSELEMRAMVPVSVRAEDEHGALGNRVAGDDGAAAGLVRGPGRAAAS